LTNINETDSPLDGRQRKRRAKEFLSRAPVVHFDQLTEINATDPQIANPERRPTTPLTHNMPVQ
jgi:hypothetical protein